MMDNKIKKILYKEQSRQDSTIELNAKFYWLPWYRKCHDEDIWMESKDKVYYNYFGWLWFAVSWMSVK